MAAERCEEHGGKLFLEHKNSEPAMKILMRNIGMTLHVIHKLRAEGIDNVQVNMDWQHLIMNGEHLPEYAALLAAEGLLGHQHAQLGLGHVRRRQHGRRDGLHGDARARARAAPRGYGANGERLGFDLYPYTEDQVGAVRRACEHWRFIDDGRRADRRRRAARGAAAQGRGPRLRARLRRARRASRMTRARRPRRRHLVGQGPGARRARHRARPSPSAATRSRRRSRAGPSRTPRTGGGAPRARCSTSSTGPARAGHRAVRADARARRARRARTAPLRPAILWNDGRTQAQCDEIEERVGPRAADRADRQPRAGRLHRAQAAVAARARARGLRADRARAAAQGLRAPAALRRARDRRHRRVGHAAASTSRSAAGATRCSRRSSSTRRGCRAAVESPEVAGRDARRRARSPAGAGDQAAGALGVGVVAEGGPASVVLGHLGRRVRRARPLRGRPRGARARLLPRRARTRWHVMGVMLSAAGLAALAARRARRRAPTSTRCSPRRRRGSPASRACSSRPYLAGERTPHADPDARGAFAGLTLRHDRGALARAVLEGVAFGLRDALDLVRDLGGAPAGRRASPAAARAADLWLEIVASVLELPLERMRGRRGRGLRRRAARRRRGGRLRRRARGRRGVRARDARRSSRGPDWVERYAEVPARRFRRRCTPALRPLSD